MLTIRALPVLAHALPMLTIACDRGAIHNCPQLIKCTFVFAYPRMGHCGSIAGRGVNKFGKGGSKKCGHKKQLFSPENGLSR